MNEQTLAIVIAGALVVAFGGLASYMADRQMKQQAVKERQDKHKTKHQHGDHLRHA